MYNIKRLEHEDLKEGKVFKRQQLIEYARDYKCVLIERNSKLGIFPGHDLIEFKINQIIENSYILDCSVSPYSFKDIDKIIIVDKIS